MGEHTMRVAGQGFAGDRSPGIEMSYEQPHHRCIQRRDRQVRFWLPRSRQQRTSLDQARGLSIRIREVNRRLDSLSLIRIWINRKVTNLVGNGPAERQDRTDLQEVPQVGIQEAALRVKAKAGGSPIGKIPGQGGPRMMIPIQTARTVVTGRRVITVILKAA